MFWISKKSRLTVAPLFLAVAVLAAFLLFSGCGDKEEEKAETPAGHSLVPANLDTLIAQTGSDRPENQVPSQGNLSAAEAAEKAAEVAAQFHNPVEEAVTEIVPEPEEAAVVSPLPVGSGLFSVQLGSFGKPDNARILADKVKALGYPATVETALVKGQTYHRVFVRGLDSRTSAENLGEELRQNLGISYLVLRNQ